MRPEAAAEAEGTLATQICASVSEVRELEAEWDALAVEGGRPFSAPAWALAWWEHLRPATAELCVVAVREREELVGIVPLLRARRRYAPLGGGIAPVEPLARPGLELRVAEAAGRALGDASSPPVTLEIEAHGSSPDWGRMLAESLGRGRPAWRWTRLRTPVPCIDLGEGFESWLQGKSSSFRREMKRKQRKLEEAGASFRFADERSLQRDVHAFMRLHRRRLAGQGGSSLTGDGVERMLIAVGESLLSGGRFRLLCIDRDGETVAAQLLLAAGREVSAWNSGFDEAQAKLSPSMQCIVEALRDASERGERTMSLGPGGQDYKYRLSNGEDALVSEALVPHGRGYPLARLRLTPAQIRRAGAARLSPEVKQRLRRLAPR